MNNCSVCNKIPVKSPRVADCYGNNFKVDLKPLGKGDVGIAYMINGVSDIKQEVYPDAEEKKYVLKQVQFRKGEDGTFDRDADLFFNETCIGIELGELGIAPRIYECWLCNDSKGNEYGFYTMDKIEYIMAYTYPGNLKRTKFMKLATKELQQKIIGLLEVMLNANYVHNDNHPGNIGIMSNGEPVLFDFGFALKADHELTNDDKLQYLGFALYQIIEQYDKSLMYDEDNLFYDLIYLIRQNKYVFGSHIVYLVHK